jgi:DNA polymerase-4
VSTWPVDARAILHVDMDAFYASVELLRHPELVGRPVAVGGSGARGVVAAASYEARRYGVHSAMPSRRATALCPDLVFLDGDHRHYGEVSGRVMEIFQRYTPLVEPLSLDEAFLDVTGSQRLHGSPEHIGRAILDDVAAAEQLPCSVGVATCKFLAKLASPRAKPVADRSGITPGPGVLVVPPGRELDFLHPLPLRALWGVGPATLAKLDRLGVDSIGDLAALPLSAVVAAVGQASGRHLHALANGVDDRPVVADGEAKSVSHEETFPRDLVDRELVDRELIRLGDAVARRLRVAGRAGRTVNLKVRYSDFSTLTRSLTLAQPTDSARVVVRTARSLMDALDMRAGIRLLGVGVSSLGTDVAQQLSFDEPDEHWHEAERAVDEIRDRFGAAAIGPAALAGGEGLRVKLQGDQQWGPSQPD